MHDHRNYHWIFNWPALWGLWLVVLVLVMILLIVNLDLEMAASILLGSSVGTSLVFALSPIVRIFPYAYIQTDRPSTRKTVRRFLTWIIPAIVTGLIVAIISKIIGIGS